MIDFSTKNIIDICLGSKTIQAGYYGTALVYQKTHPVYEPYITFTANRSSEIGLVTKASTHTIQYSKDKVTWKNMTTSTDISLSTGEKVYIRGILSGNCSSSNYTTFSIDAHWGYDVTLSGNINTLWNYENPNAVLKEYCGYHLFDGCSGLTDISGLELPATTLTTNCYQSMFSGCSIITSVPLLPATTLANGCYRLMFNGCTSLTTAPELPAITLSDSCYSYMFSGCSSLTSVPALLPATTLVNSCYYGMFHNCTSLTAAPELPATTLQMMCYENMFNGCSSLNYVKCLATDISAFHSTSIWLDGVSSTGTFVKDASMTGWGTGSSGIPSNWTIQNA